MKKTIFSITFILIINLALILAENNDVKYTPKEREALREFFGIMENDLYRNFMKRDEFLIHWLREYNMDLLESRKNLLKAISWRKTNKIDGILNEDKMKRIKKLMPFSFDTVDKEGRPILGFVVENWDVRKYVLKGMQSDLKRYQSYILERSLAKAIDLNYENEKIGINQTISQYVHVGDFEEYSLWTHGCLSCVPVYSELITNYQTYYPNSAYKMISINATRTYETLLQLLRPLMSPNLKKIFISYGQNKEMWTKELSKFIPRETIPKIFD